MKNNMSKIIWGTFLLGMGLMWICASLGLLRDGAFSGLLFSFILILVGISILFKGSKEDKEKEREKQIFQEEGTFGEEGEAYREASEDKDYNGYDSSKGDWEESPGRKNSGKEHYTSILSSQNIRCTEEFTGAEITSIAGGLELDLRNAVISRDIVIDVNCFLGGITIFLPSGVTVSVSCTPIMGGVESKIDGSLGRKENKATVYIRGICFMGGIEIR